jgi:hypothetical protein
VFCLKVWLWVDGVLSKGLVMGRSCFV